MPDVAVGLSYTYTSGSENFVAPAEPDSMVGLSFSLPVPLWNRQKAEIRTARLTAEQAQKMLDAADLKAEVQVRQAFGTYRTMTERVQKFRVNCSKEPTRCWPPSVLATSTARPRCSTCWKRNGAPTAFTRVKYALADAAKALIELERATTVWDVAF